jgi:membrane protease YdiL (CAAX protease family)
MEAPSESPVRLIPSFCVASLLFYLACAISFLVPGGGPKESLLEQAARPVLFLIPALLITFRIAWLLRRPHSPEQKGRGLKITLPLSLLAVMLGALLISVILFGRHWGQLF